MSRLAVIDYDSGNLYSVVKALERTAPAGAEVELVDDEARLTKADRVVFPGQGSPKACMANLLSRRLIEPIREALRNKPFLGICMGMQLMFAGSEEGGVDCLGLIGDSVRRLRAKPGAGPGFRLPHIGWNQVSFARAHPMLEGIGANPWFYFVHSYAWLGLDHDAAIGFCAHGEPFCAALERGNVFCTQFHPEKSAQAGLRLLSNFHRWQPPVGLAPQ